MTNSPETPSVPISGEVSDVAPTPAPAINADGNDAGQPPPPPSPSPTGTQVSSDGSEYISVVVGEIYDGARVDAIYGARSHAYIVYEAGGRLRHNAVDSGVPFHTAAEAMAAEVMDDADIELNGAYASRIRTLLGSALVRAFEANSEDGVGRAFQRLRKFIAASIPVKRVFGRTRDYIVFTNREGIVEWQADSTPPAMLATLGEFQRLNQLARLTLTDTDLTAYSEIIGQELVGAFRVALSGAPLPTTESSFVSAREYVGVRSGATVGNRYIAANLIVGLAFGAVAITCKIFPPFWLAKDARLLAIGALAGLIGTIISVLERSASLTVANYATSSQMWFQAIVRCTLGLIFGSIVVIAIKGNVAFGAFKANSYGVFVLAVVAGFSERLVPDLLDSLAKTASGQSTRQSRSNS